MYTFIRIQQFNYICTLRFYVSRRTVQCLAWEDILFTQTQKKPYGCTLNLLQRDHNDEYKKKSLSRRWWCGYYAFVRLYVVRPMENCIVTLLLCTWDDIVLMCNTESRIYNVRYRQKIITALRMRVLWGLRLIMWWNVLLCAIEYISLSFRRENPNEKEKEFHNGVLVDRKCIECS